MRKLLILLNFLFPLSLLAQSTEVDSLKKVLNQSTTPIQRIDVLSALAKAHYNFDPDQGHSYAVEAHQLASAENYSPGIRHALTLEGNYFYEVGDFKKALYFFKSSQALEEDEDTVQAYNLIMTGNTYQVLAIYDSAELHYRKAIEVLSRVTNDTYLALAHMNLGRLLTLQWKKDQAEASFKKALMLAERNHNREAMAYTWYALAALKKNEGERDQAHGIIDQACDVASRQKNWRLQLQCDISQGEIHFLMGDNSEALRNLFEAQEKMKRVILPELLTRLYGDLGEIYEALGQNAISLKYSLESLKLAEQAGMKHQVSRIQPNVAYIYKNQGNFLLAHDYIDKSLALTKSTGDKNGFSLSLNSKGLIYFDQKNYDSAMAFFDRSLTIRRLLGNKPDVSTCLFNKAKILVAQNRFQEALVLYDQVLVIEKELANEFNLGIAYNTISDLHIRLKNYPKAFEYLSVARKMAQITGSKTVQMENDYQWSVYYESRGELAQALRFHKKYTALNDSIYSERSADQLAEIQALYQLDKQDHEINLLNQEKLLQQNEIKLQQSKIGQQAIIISSIIIVLLLISLLAIKTFHYNRKIKKANREITEQKEEIQCQSEELIATSDAISKINVGLEYKIEQRTDALKKAYKELDTFFYRASHDFRRPLTTFLGLAEVAAITLKDANALDLFDKVKTTALNLDKMLIKLHAISEVGSQELIRKEVMLQEIFDTVHQRFSETLRNKNIRISADINVQKPFISYPTIIKPMVDNLIENAIQFCGAEDPFIRLKAYQTGDLITIEVHDNGSGIPKEYQPQVFDMYFRASERSTGNGLGLYIVKKAVQRLNGTVVLTSDVGAGTTIAITLSNNYRMSDL
jgi:signal transduction histidine kinase/tetratricopeptide (TPR) repeat protein